MPDSKDFSRERQLQRLSEASEFDSDFDIVVVGGGATGVGVAVDAAARGYRVALCEQHDFGKGTSSRSTKLIHGGVRYLQQGNVSLVRDSLRERGRLLKNAPHLVHPLPVIVPLYAWWEPAYYWLGLKAYDLLAGRWGLGSSARLSRDETLAELSTLKADGLRGGIRYYDAAFDDTRLLVNLVQTAVEQGAVCANYLQVTGLVRSSDRVVGVRATDLETGEEFEIKGKVVVNAAGPFSDQVRRLDDPQAAAWIAPSQGAHIVLPRRFLPSSSALIVPKTADGRVVFAIPWHDHTLVGTTDTPLDATLDAAPLEPVALPEEVDFLLKTVSDYLSDRPERGDVLSVFAGLRPLVKKEGSRHTSRLERDHQVRVAESGLVSIVGGKWTTYRQMAQDCVDVAAKSAGLPQAESATENLPVHGAEGTPLDGRLAIYGSDGAALQRLLDENAAYREQLDAALPYTVGEAIWAVRHEMARSIEDVLSRRLRALILNAPAALRSAPRVAEILAAELGRDSTWAQEEIDRFQKVAQGYTAPGS
jgi:glycerol-3-phosphate dehydrogenase